MKLLFRLLVIVVVLVGFVYLFLRTAHDARSAPYIIPGQHMQGWVLAIEAGGARTAPLLVLRPPQQFAGELFSQVFSRMMESLRGSTVAAIPLILRDEYELALAARYTPEALLDAARTAGLEAGAFQPNCLAIRRVSAPGATRQMYYVLFDSPAFVRFREEIADALQATVPGAFSPPALSPVLIVASTDGTADEWLPIGPDAERDCVAPIVVE